MPPRCSRPVDSHCGASTTNASHKPTSLARRRTQRAQAQVRRRARWRSDRRLPHGIRRLPHDGLDDQRAGSAQSRSSRTRSPSSTSRSRRSTASRPTRQRFIARMEVIEKLQRSRPEIVHIFDEIAKQLPDGVYLTGDHADRHPPQVRRYRPVLDARVRVHAQHRRLELPQESRARHRRDQEEQRDRCDLHPVRRAGRFGSPSLRSIRTSRSGALRRRELQQ